MMSFQVRSVDRSVTVVSYVKLRLVPGIPGMSSSRPMVARPVRYGRRNNVKLIYSRACSRVGYIPYIPTGEVVLRASAQRTARHGRPCTGWTAWATPCHPEMGFADQ